MNHPRLSPRRGLWRRADALRALGWLALLVALVWGGLACSSGYYWNGSGMTPLSGHSLTFERVGGADSGAATAIAVTHAFDIGYENAALCPSFSQNLQRGVLAIAVPDRLSVGTVSRAAGSAPYVTVHPQGQPGNVTRYDLVYAPERVADVEGAISSVIPVTHWETFAFPAGATWDCAVELWDGELHFTLEYSETACIGCELEVALLARQPIQGLPFHVAGPMAPISRLIAPIALDWAEPPQILTLWPELAMWGPPAHSNGPIYHSLTNHTSQPQTVMLAFNSSRGDSSWRFYRDYAGAQPIMGPLTLAAGAKQTVYLKRTTPAAFTGFEFVTIEAMVPTNPLMSAHAIDTFGVASNWSQPAEFSFAYMPLLLKP